MLEVSGLVWASFSSRKRVSSRVYPRASSVMEGYSQKRLPRAASMVGHLAGEETETVAPWSSSLRTPLAVPLLTQGPPLPLTHSMFPLLGHCSCSLPRGHCGLGSCPSGLRSDMSREVFFEVCKFTVSYGTHSSVLAWRIPGTGAWWAAVYGVTQSRTRLMWLSSNSSMGSLGNLLLFSCL